MSFLIEHAIQGVLQLIRKNRGYIIPYMEIRKKESTKGFKKNKSRYEKNNIIFIGYYNNIIIKKIYEKLKIKDVIEENRSP